MAVRKKPSASKATASAALPPLEEALASALHALERAGTKKTRDGFARYGIVAPKSFGVTMADIQAIAKKIGRRHELAGALWESGWYEARLLAAFVGEEERLTSAEMDRWCKDFDNWGVCDTLCFKLFDRSPLAWKKIAPWAKKKAEFERRAGFALMACLALHDKEASDAELQRFLPLIESGASDERNFVKKGVSWALRSIGRRSRALREASIALARRLAASEDPTERWVGKDALKDLAKVK